MDDIQREELIDEHIEECKHRISVVNNFMETNKDADESNCCRNIMRLKAAISAMEELQEYHKTGLSAKQVIENAGTKMTRADKIRSMSNEELADFIMETGAEDYLEFCKNTEGCDELEPEERKTNCRQCLLEYLEGDYEES